MARKHKQTGGKAKRAVLGLLALAVLGSALYLGFKSPPAPVATLEQDVPAKAFFQES